MTKPHVQTLEEQCAHKGMRMTEQRRVIARVLSESQDHPDVESLHERAVAVDPRISIATVYRTVRLFEEAGILDRHDFGDGRARYKFALVPINRIVPNRDLLFLSAGLELSHAMNTPSDAMAGLLLAGGALTQGSNLLFFILTSFGEKREPAPEPDVGPTHHDPDVTLQGE